MAQPSHFTQLSAARQILVRLFQSLNFGHIQDLHIRSADPIFDPPPTVFADVKLDSEECQRAEAALPDFTLRDEVCRLLYQLDQLQNGTIERIEVRSGLPRRVVIERRLTEAPQ